MFDLTANLSGSLFELPGGPLGLAVGVEYRDLKGRFDPDPVVAAGFSSDIPAQPTKGSYNVKEAYAEVNAPLLCRSTIRRPAGVDRCGSLLRLFAGHRDRPRPSRPASTGSPCRTSASARPGRKGSGRRQIGELFGTASRFDQQLSDPCSTNSTRPRRFNNDADGARELHSRRRSCGRQLCPVQSANFGRSSVATRICSLKRRKAGCWVPS